MTEVRYVKENKIKKNKARVARENNGSSESQKEKTRRVGADEERRAALRQGTEPGTLACFFWTFS